MSRQLLTLFLLFLLTGCVSTATKVRPLAYYDQQSLERDNKESLFSSDATLLSDADIERILNHPYQPPKLSRLAILPFGWQFWSRYSEETALLTEEIKKSLIQTLGSSPQIFDASFMPSILIPEQRTVPHLRQAAARYQSDLVLVYRSSCRQYEKYRFFSPDQAKAYCSVESVLLDVRTGLVPFTAVSSREYQAHKQNSELSFHETQMRSQLNAIAKALGDVADLTVAFLDPSGKSELDAVSSNQGFDQAVPRLGWDAAK